MKRGHNVDCLFFCDHRIEPDVGICSVAVDVIMRVGVGVGVPDLYLLGAFDEFDPVRGIDDDQVFVSRLFDQFA